MAEHLTPIERHIHSMLLHTYVPKAAVLQQLEQDVANYLVINQPLPRREERVMQETLVQRKKFVECLYSIIDDPTGTPSLPFSQLDQVRVLDRTLAMSREDIRWAFIFCLLEAVEPLLSRSRITELREFGEPESHMIGLIDIIERFVPEMR